MSTTWLASPLSTTIRRLRCGLGGESQRPRRSRCRMLGGFSCRENAKRVDVLERLVSRPNGRRGLERLNIVDTDSYTALGMKSTLAKVPRRIIIAAEKNLNEMRAKQRLLAMRSQRRQVTMTGATKTLNKLNLIRLSCFFLCI